MSGRHFKIDADRRQELLELYLAYGMKAVDAKAREYGVTPRYVAFFAWSNGLTRRHRRGAKDARWERAKRIGPVIA